MMMDVIYAGITAEDIDGDGHIELIACDRLGNVVAFDYRGEEKWEARVTGSIHAVRPPHIQYLHSLYVN